MTDLYRRNGGAPAPLPAIAYDAQGQAWTDLENNKTGRMACGFVKAAAKPAFDPSTQIVVWDASSEAWRVDDLPPSTVVDPTFRPIDKVEAIALIRAVTGMTDEQELAFRDDTRLALFWRKWREDVGGTIHHDNPLTAAILDALQGTGYLDAGQRAAVLANWPTT